MNFDFLLENEAQTLEFGAKISNFARTGDSFALFGDLGAGKTTFARGFIQKALGYEYDIPSPTFTIVQTYETSLGSINHFDLYRIENKEEIWELGWEEISNHINIIEWPNHACDLIPNNRVEINIEFNAAQRIAKIKIFGNGDFVSYWQNIFKELD